MSIFAAKFTGRQIGAIGIFYPITAYCNGETADAAHLDLYNRYDHISRLTLTPVPIVTLAECVPEDRICIVENGRLVGDTKPRESDYAIALPANAIPGLIPCVAADGTLHHFQPTQTCIVWNRAKN